MYHSLFLMWFIFLNQLIQSRMWKIQETTMYLDKCGILQPTKLTISTTLMKAIKEIFS